MARHRVARPERDAESGLDGVAPGGLVGAVGPGPLGCFVGEGGMDAPAHQLDLDIGSFVARGQQGEG